MCREHRDDAPSHTSDDSTNSSSDNSTLQDSPVSDSNDDVAVDEPAASDEPSNTSDNDDLDLAEDDEIPNARPLHPKSEYGTGRESSSFRPQRISSSDAPCSDPRPSRPARIP